MKDYVSAATAFLVGMAIGGVLLLGAMFVGAALR